MTEKSEKIRRNIQTEAKKTVFAVFTYAAGYNDETTDCTVYKYKLIRVCVSMKCQCMHTYQSVHRREKNDSKVH